MILFIADKPWNLAVICTLSHHCSCWNCCSSQLQAHNGWNHFPQSHLHTSALNWTSQVLKCFPSIYGTLQQRVPLTYHELKLHEELNFDQIHSSNQKSQLNLQSLLDPMKATQQITVLVRSFDKPLWWN